MPKHIEIKGNYKDQDLEFRFAFGKHEMRADGSSQFKQLLTQDVVLTKTLALTAESYTSIVEFLHKDLDEFCQQTLHVIKEGIQW